MIPNFALNFSWARIYGDIAILIFFENDLKFDPEALKVMAKLNKLKLITEQMKAKCQSSPLQNYSAGQIWNEIKSFGYDVPFTVFVIACCVDLHFFLKSISHSVSGICPENAMVSYWQITGISSPGPFELKYSFP